MSLKSMAYNLFLECWFLSVIGERSKTALSPSAVLSLVWLRCVPSDMWADQGEKSFPVWFLALLQPGKGEITGGPLIVLTIIMLMEN